VFKAGETELYNCDIFSARNQIRGTIEQLILGIEACSLSNEKFNKL